jgi:large subunit ribosomal protein L21
MYAIIDYQGKQYKVEPNMFIYTNRVNAEEGAALELDKVLLLDQNGKVTVGTPNVQGASIQAKVLAHVRDNKVIVFKKKRRKGYQKSTGHRQDLTKILIEKITI